VHVAHGDLRFARNHLIVGHYAGSTLVGGEAALDQLLDGRLSRAAMLGIYPGGLETCQVFTDPDKWSTPPGAVVAGLGPIGQLSAASLARAVAHAALTAALGHLSIARPRKVSRRTGGVLQMRLSSLLIATGAGGLPVRDSVQALLTGIQRANDRLADTGMGVHICDLEVIELWQDRALQALDAVGASMSTGELAECFVLDPRLREMPGRQRRLVFSERDGWWQQVRVRSESDGSLTFEASVGRAGTPTRTVGTQRALVDRLVESLVDTPSPDAVSAHTLFELLFPNDLKAQAPDTDNIVLVVDRGSAHFPWELLDDHGADRSGDGERRTPLGVRRGLVRQLEGTTMRSHVLSATTGRAFVIGDTRAASVRCPPPRTRRGLLRRPCRTRDSSAIHSSPPRARKSCRASSTGPTASCTWPGMASSTGRCRRPGPGASTGRHTSPGSSSVAGCSSPPGRSGSCARCLSSSSSTAATSARCPRATRPHRRSAAGTTGSPRASPPSSSTSVSAPSSRAAGPSTTRLRRRSRRRSTTRSSPARPSVTP